jgi:carbon storage regulator
MQIMSRMNGESLVVGDEVVVTVLQILGGRVRLGVEAPHYMAVSRKEIYEAVWREKPGPRAEPGVEKSQRSTMLALTEAQADDFEEFRREISMRARHEISADQAVRLLFYVLGANRFHNMQAAAEAQMGWASSPPDVPPDPPPAADGPR